MNGKRYFTQFSYRFDCVVSTVMVIPSDLGKGVNEYKLLTAFLLDQRYIPRTEMGDKE
jgi:hypothetical protein